MQNFSLKPARVALQVNINEDTFIEQISSHPNYPSLLSIFRYYRDRGFATAIDDFGAGYAGLGLLTDFQPHIIKIDIKLVRDIDTNFAKQATVQGILLTCKMLNIQIIAEGIETAAEARWFLDNGIYLMQGFYFARPGFESLPTISDWSLT